MRIAGCLSPLFGSYHPELTISFEETLGIYRRIVAQQAERVDLMLCETMASAEEARAAAIAASESGKPVWVSWTLADDGQPRLRSGETLATAAAALEGIALDARLVNCSRPEAVDAAMPDLLALGGPVGAYANAFPAVDKLKHGGTVDVLGAPRRSRARALRRLRARLGRGRRGASSAAAARPARSTSPRCATGCSQPVS